MIDLFNKVNKKINSIIWSLVSTGIVLVLLAVFVVYTDFMLRLVVGLFILVVAYSFFYSGYKIWSLRNDIKKYLKIE